MSLTLVVRYDQKSTKYTTTDKKIINKTAKNGGSKVSEAETLITQA